AAQLSVRRIAHFQRRIRLVVLSGDHRILHRVSRSHQRVAKDWVAAPGLVWGWNQFADCAALRSASARSKSASICAVSLPNASRSMKRFGALAGCGVAALSSSPKNSGWGASGTSTFSVLTFANVLR